MSLSVAKPVIIAELSYGEKEGPATCPSMSEKLTNISTDEDLEPYVHIPRDAVGPDFLLLEEQREALRSHLVNEFLEKEDIHRMDWLVRSPYLNPIGYVWDTLWRAIRNSLYPIKDY
ncbi:transposable element Tcb2 transposase [Trichonephila clavipes]|nr:transposable element Tcb2 transposase [Trichonephila clavipes]